MDLRAAPVMAALRLALLHAILPASRLGTGPGRACRRSASRPATSGRTSGTQFRERNPWLAFEDAFRTRPRVHPAPRRGRARARPGAPRRGPAEPRRRRGDRLRRPDRPDRVRRPARRPERLRPDGADAARSGSILGQPPMRPSLERLAAAYHATSWVLGREAAALLPLDGLAGASLRGPWAVQATSMAARPRGGRTRVRPRWPGRLARRRRSGGDRRDRPRRGLGGLPPARRAPGRPGRRRAGRGRADLAQRPPAARFADAGERRARARCRAGPATRASSRRATCSRRRRVSTTSRSRRRRRPGS